MDHRGQDEGRATGAIAGGDQQAAARLGLPAGLADATAIGAAQDADRVALFLHELGLLTRSDPPVRLPPAFLLHLGAALRILVWEASGLQVHRDSGLPEAGQAILSAFSLLALKPETESQHPDELARKVVALFAGRFAWHARRDLDADVVLDDHFDEDALVDALAELLWDARPNDRTPGDAGAP